LRILVNALSVANLSGRHVVTGHISRLAQWMAPLYQFVVLHHAGNADLRDSLGSTVDWVEAPPNTAHWLPRSAWERLRLATLTRQLRSDAVLTFAGTITAGVGVPQLCFAQNPWCLVPSVHRGLVDRPKAALQRHAYREAMSRAALMIFNSHYMRRAYRDNAGCLERASAIVYQAVDDETHAAAALAGGHLTRDPLRILSVSAMAPHKGADTLVRALAHLRRDVGIPATLALVGAWPHAGYRREVETLIRSLGVQSAVSILGHVSRGDLHHLYASSRVFALMSECESFGIPAVEAQAFGTPIVSSNCCAIPEVCGDAGLFPEPRSVEATAEALRTILTSDVAWATLSERARSNAARFRWDACTRTFEQALRDVA
jgi:glycosyltransferase involved in cell wall biosynthesis